jgi:2-oxoglutarate ferredoxin oxidoreductase subunit delta
MEKREVEIYIDEKICTGCGICIEFCPKKVFSFAKKRSPGGTYIAQVEYSAACSHCRLCELYCPAFALCVEEKDDG